MKILYDARHIAAPFTGLGRYSGCLAEALLLTHDNDVCDLHMMLPPDIGDGNPFQQTIRQHHKDGRCRISEIGFSPFQPFQFNVAHWLNRQKADLYFYPHFNPPTGLKTPFQFVIHDLTPLRVKDYVQRFAMLKRAYFRLMIRQALKNAQHCFCVSRTTRSDVEKTFAASNVSVAYPASTLAVAHSPETPPTRPFLLVVGDRRPHKNLRHALDLFAALRRSHDYAGRLVLAGPTRSYSVDFDTGINADPDINALGAVSDETLAGLYQGADALLVLSLYEGFGLPVIEAAQLGCKTVVSDGGSLPEIAPVGSCILPIAMSVAESAQKLADYLNSNQRPDPAKVAAQFSWETAARQIFPQAYRE